jgi:hypothetical protein
MIELGLYNLVNKNTTFNYTTVNIGHHRTYIPRSIRSFCCQIFHLAIFNIFFYSNISLDFLWRCCINIFCLIMIASLPWREDCNRVHLKICTRIQPPQPIRPLHLARTVASQVHMRTQFSQNRTAQKLPILGNVSCPVRHIIW